MIAYSWIAGNGEGILVIQEIAMVALIGKQIKVVLRNNQVPQFLNFDEISGAQSAFKLIKELIAEVAHA